MSYSLSASSINTINSTLPTLMPQSVVELSPNVFKVLSVFVPLSRELDNDDIKQMHAAALGDQFSLVPESVEYVRDEGRKIAITSMVVANIISKPYKEETTAGMRVIQANVFMDNESAIWKVVGKGENRRLVQNIREDFKSLITSRINSSRNELIASVINKGVPQIEVNPGDFVLFYNTESNAVDCGFALSEDDKYKVFSYDSKEFYTVSPQAMIRCIDGGTLINAASLVKSAEFDMTDGEFNPQLSKKYQDYMQFLYNGTDYFNNLKSLLQLRHRNGVANLPVSTMKNL
jgi:hypothetical protein